MEPFRRLAARACALPLANIDTDQLIPARFMKQPRSAGYGRFLLHDLRFAADGTARADCPLNAPAAAGAQILVARRNFGAGSSREAAVYALADYGIRCVVAPTFGDIFASNAVNNGLLPARVSDDDAETLIAALADAPADLVVDLDACTILGGPAGPVRFSIDPVWRTKLLNGWDDVDLTASYRARIDAWNARDAALRPWVQPHVGAHTKDNGPRGA